MDADVLLATLAQSTAAVVAIIGGFLVSRLVALSSERDGLRRQKTTAEAHLLSVAADYRAAHTVRLEYSRANFEDSVLSDVVNRKLDPQALLRDRVPRGSSTEEMRPVLEALIARVIDANKAIRAKLKQSDDERVDLDDLVNRGLVVPASEQDIYDHVMYQLRTEELPSQTFQGFPLNLGATIFPPMHVDPGGIAARRLDESIRDEQNLLGRKVGLEQEVERLASEIELIGRPVGVTSAIGILAAFSFVGIAAPLVVMVLNLPTLEAWLEWWMLGAFLVGLAAVLGYILWYARTLSDPVEAADGDST